MVNISIDDLKESKWATVPLGELASFVMGQAPPGSASNFEGIGEVFVKAGEFGPERPETREWTTQPLKYATKGDVLICVVGATAGKLNLGIDCAIGRSVAAIQPSNALDQKYLFYQLLQHVETFRSGSTGSAQGVISKKQLGEFKIKLAPQNEQSRIADKLDTTLAAVEACKQKLNNAAETIQRFRQSVLATAVSGELTREWREERGIENISTKLQIKDLGIVVTGNTPRKETGEATKTLPLFKPTELDDGYQVNEAKEMMSEARAKDARILPERSVLVTCIGATIGKTGLSRVKGATNQQINSLVCDEKVALPEWAYFWFCSPKGQAQVINNASATTLPILNKSRFSSINLEVPSIAEQQVAVSQIERLFENADEIEKTIQTTLNKCESLQKAILAKAFRGELVPQDPNDEPASVLLERIKVQREAEAATKKPGKRGRKKKADAAVLVIPEGIADNHLAKVLEECGALSELALLAASELEPEVFQLQLSKELNAGGLKEVDVAGEAAYADAAWEEE